MSRGLRPGDVFGPYRVIKMLGRGAMGEVALVQHVQLGARYAFKVLGRALAGDSAARQRFAREMEALAQVDAHPGIVRVHANGILPDGRPYFVMEYVEGQTLARALRHGLTSEVGIEVVIEVAQALGFLHQHGIVHRDVKPENVLLAGEGRARLSDFGLAKAVAGDDQRLTLTGELIGTPAYMAPEQARGVGEIGPFTDVYACGVILYEVLAGRLPHQGNTAIEICMHVAEGKPFPAPSSERAGVSPAVEAVCLRALSLEPRDRYPDGDAFAVALRAAQSEGEAPPRSTLPFVGVAIALVLLCAGGVVAWSQAGTPAVDTAQAALPDALVALQAHADAGRWQRVLEGVDAAEGWTGSAQEAWTRILTQAREARIADAWAKGDLKAGCAAWDLGAPLSDPAAAWVLAAAGRASEAPLTAIESAHERAWLAAWAGDRAGCEAALGELTPHHAEALRWRLRSSLPALSSDAPLELEPTEPAARHALAERALALGRLGAAAALLSGANELHAAELIAARAVARARLALAWGETEPLEELVERRLGRKPEGLARLETWALAREVAAWLPLEDREALLHDLPSALRDPLRPWALDGGARLARARGLVRAQDPAARDAWAEAGADPVLAGHSPARADLDACARGLDGPAGLALARVAAVAQAIEAGGAQVSLVGPAQQLLTRLRVVRAGSPALALVELRLRRLSSAPTADDWLALEQASPGDPARLREEALAAERWCGWRVEGERRRLPEGYSETAEAWKAVEEASASEADVREARLRRVEALVSANLGGSDASWAEIAALLTPYVGEFPVAAAAEAARELHAALDEGELEQVAAQREQLAALARGVSRDTCRALYLRALTGDVDAADAYVGVVGDAPALELLELRLAEQAAHAHGGLEALNAQARALADALPVPYARLLTAATHADERAVPSLDPLDVARVVEEDPAELSSVLTLLREHRPAAKPEALLERIASSQAAQSTRLVARALLFAWFDLQGRLEATESWSLRGVDALGAALERSPADPGLRQLRGALLLSPRAASTLDPWVQRAARFDTELAAAALPWALGPAIQRLRVLSSAEDVHSAVERLAMRGWLWAGNPALPAGVDPPAEWPTAFRDFRSWDPQGVSDAISALARSRRASNLAPYLFLREAFYVELLQKDDPAFNNTLIHHAVEPQLRRAALTAWAVRSADVLDGNDTREAARRSELPALVQAPSRRMPLVFLSGLASGPALQRVRQRPQLTELWAQEVAHWTGWCESQHVAELWNDLLEDDDSQDRLFSTAQLRDPWSRTRAILAGLHDSFTPHASRALNSQRYPRPSRWTAAVLRGVAFDRCHLPLKSFYTHVEQQVRFRQRGFSTTRSKRALALAALFEPFGPSTTKAIRVDVLLDHAAEAESDRRWASRDRDDDEPESEDERTEREARRERYRADRDERLAEGIRLALELDPESVDRACESRAVSWYRRVRAAALAEDSAALEVALEAFAAARTPEDAKLARLLRSEPWSRRLRDAHPALHELLPRRRGRR